MKNVENCDHIIRGKCVITSLSITLIQQLLLFDSRIILTRRAQCSQYHSYYSGAQFLLYLSIFLLSAKIHGWPCLELRDSFLSCIVATYVDFLFWSILVSPHRSHIMHEVSRSYVFLHSNVLFYKILVLLQTYFSSTQNICFDHCTISHFYINLDNLYGDHMLSHNLNNSRDESVYHKFSYW